MSNFLTVQPIRGVTETKAKPMPVSADTETAFVREQGEGTESPAYGRYFGVFESPFSLTPDPKYLFRTSEAQEALSNLRYGLTQSRGMTVLIGDAGTGKTTLIRTAMDELPEETTKCVLLSNPALSREEFYEFLAAAFRFSGRAAVSKTRFLTELEADLRARADQGGVTGLIVDEAQSLPHALLEEIRLLGNIETASRKLLNVVLSGQPELAERLNEPGLRQLKQRVALRCQLSPLTTEESFAYVSGRIRIAGGAPEKIFTSEAVLAAHRAAAGIPRSLNVICDNALLSAFALQVQPITARIVTDVCRDFDFAQPAGTVTKPAAADTGLATVAPLRKKSAFSFFS
jgi:general secretion pathway protein A